jgi:hypothetical protein
MHKGLVWSLFLVLTAFQVMNNVYFTYVNLTNYTQWIELFGLQDFTKIEQMRILSIVSGAVLPLVALGFIKSLVDYIQPEKETDKQTEDLKLEKDYKISHSVDESAVDIENLVPENETNETNPHQKLIKGGL